MTQRRRANFFARADVGPPAQHHSRQHKEHCGAWLRCRWAAAGPGRASRRRADQRPGPTGVEGAGRSCRSAGGRWQGLAGLRGDAPISGQAPLVWRAPEGPEGTGGLRGAVPVGGDGAWPGFETTRRAKLAARTTRGRAAAHRHTQRPGPPAPGTPVGPQASPQRNEAVTGFPATASSRSRSAAQQSGTAQVSAVHNSATSDQAVMST